MFETDILNAFKRFTAMERTERTVVFPVLSDLHAILEDIDTSEPGLRNTLPAIEAVHQADKLFDFDFFVDLGDIGLELPQNEGEEARARLLRAYSNAHHDTLKPSIVCMGNHDYDHGNLTAAEFGDIMDCPNMERGHVLNFGENSSYGYYDIEGKRTRIFFLNTSNGNPYMLDEKQLDFLEKNLILPEYWYSVVLMHACPHCNGHCVRVPYKMPPSFARFGQIVSQSSCPVVVFCGDSHFDNDFFFGNMPGFLTQGYGGATGNYLPRGARLTRFDSSRTMLAEVAVLRPELRRIDVLRMGVNDACSDRAASF